MIREKAPTILTAEGARRLTARIRDALVMTDNLLVQAYEGRAWEALGHASWTAYCAAELPHLRQLKLRAPERKALAEKLRAEGASIPEIVAATGASLGAIHRDLNPKVQVEAPEPFQMESPPPVQEFRWQTVVRLVAAQGARGLTCLEFEHETGWRHGSASGAFDAAVKKGRVRRVASFRSGYAAYVIV